MCRLSYKFLNFAQSDFKKFSIRFNTQNLKHLQVIIVSVFTSTTANYNVLSWNFPHCTRPQLKEIQLI